MGARIASLALLFSAIVFAPTSSAQLIVDRLWVDLAADSAGREDVVVGNESSDRYYVTLSVAEILNPGTEAETRRAIANPEELGLLVSPSRIILEPGATRAVRIVSIAEPPERDRVYRLMISPQVTDIDAPGTRAEDEVGVNIKILMAYDILIVSRPNNPAPQITKKVVDGAIVLANSGNSNALLTDGKICASGQNGACTSIEDARLYAGAELRIPTDVKDPKVEYRRRTLARGESLVVNY